MEHFINNSLLNEDLIVEECMRKYYGRAKMCLKGYCYSGNHGYINTCIYANMYLE